MPSAQTQAAQLTLPRMAHLRVRLSARRLTRIRVAGNFRRSGWHLLCVKRKGLLAGLFALITIVGLGLLPGTAHADGDPGSDVLVYQNLFVAADADISVQQQLQLGNLLTEADEDGFPVRVAVISQPDDLGAITALWDKPAAYATFLGTELSLAYAQRLLIVMPNGFGFNWQGHSASAAYKVLDGVHIGTHGPGLAAAAQNAVLALARASGVRLTVPAGGAAGAAPSTAGAAGGPASGASSGQAPVVQPTASTPTPAQAPPGSDVPLVVGIAIGVALVGVVFYRAVPRGWSAAFSTGCGFGLVLVLVSLALLTALPRTARE